MVHSINQIALYKKIDNRLIDYAGIRFTDLSFIYSQASGEEKAIEIPSDAQYFIEINEYDDMWSPSENNLIVKQKLQIDKPYLLFGENGVANKDSIIGFGVHMHSKTSGFQKTLDIGSITDRNDSLELNFQYEFFPSTIRGIVHLDFFLYVKEVHTTNPKFANHSGMILSLDDLNTIEIVVDGSGSNFPINEFEEKGGPLWKLEKNWADAAEDSFDSSNVNLALNKEHPLFDELRKDSRRVNRLLMGNIMIQAMSMIIQQTVLVEKLKYDDEEDILPGSILSAVAYWINTFEVDTSSLFAIQNSLLRSLDETVLEGDKND
ncbi:hypothetical protein [Staphylococcus simulans]|uniref:hypothetical protein n=1 Tax=Staphylococcus simulans TaxID=1286 RepID=UPI000E6857E8|nr:hypothetical protein [Staphylococcus simulans]RIN55579.1 hypothetical protein BU029_02045 [Staphylococcus simulans]